MQSVVQDNRLQDVRTRLLEEIKATKKRINPVHHPLFNLTMQNKIDHANRILRLMDRYPNMTVQELFHLIACRIEGEKFAIIENYLYIWCATSSANFKLSISFLKLLSSSNIATKGVS